MVPGISSFLRLSADLVIANSAAFVSSGLKSPIGASAKQKCRWWVPFTVGATGGIKAKLAVPAGGSVFLASIVIHNCVANTILASVQTAAASFGNAVADAGNHFLEVECLIENGATAGDIDLQVAQNSADALSLTVLKDSFLSVVTFG